MAIFSHFRKLILPSGRDNFKSCKCILLKFVLHVTNNQCSDKFNYSGGLLSSVFLCFNSVGPLSMSLVLQLKLQWLNASFFAGRAMNMALIGTFKCLNGLV